MNSRHANATRMRGNVAGPRAAGSNCDRAAADWGFTVIYHLTLAGRAQAESGYPEWADRCRTSLAMRNYGFRDMSATGSLTGDRRSPRGFGLRSPIIGSHIEGKSHMRSHASE